MPRSSAGAADSVGRDFWSKQLQNGVSETDVVLGLVTSTEYLTKWSTNDILALHLYEDVLSREPTTTELEAAQSEL